MKPRIWWHRDFKRWMMDLGGDLVFGPFGKDSLADWLTSMSQLEAK